MGSVNTVFKNTMIDDYSLYFSSRAPGNSLIDKTHEIQGMMKLTSVVCYILYLNILFYIGVQPVNPGEENSNPLQYSCLENSMDRGVWWATVHGVTKSWTQLSD